MATTSYAAFCVDCGKRAILTDEELEIFERFAQIDLFISDVREFNMPAADETCDCEASDEV